MREHLRRVRLRGTKSEAFADSWVPFLEGGHVDASVLCQYP
jgi:hypothetical protein